MPCGTRHWLAVSTAKAMRLSTNVVSPFTRGRIASSGHIAAVNRCIAGEDPQRGGVTCHLDVGILEHILISV